VFFTRDFDDENAIFGLFPDGWSLNGEDNCTLEGDLSNQGGEIFVR
jgi:hypothetical protein